MVPLHKYSSRVVYPSVCLLAFLGFIIVTFIRASVVRVPLMFIMLSFTFPPKTLLLTFVL